MAIQSPPTLVILAAGMASRYGSMKQIQAFGPGGETIMDYSIYDAIKAGFKKIVFIIRKEFAKDFSEIFEPKLKGRVAIDYVFQDLHAFTDNLPIPTERTKPWGTAHAVLCARDVVKEPFAVINADDFYGRDAFQKAYQFLTSVCADNIYSIIGYDLLKTLSENGTVNRGVCQVDEKGNLSSIAERINISRQDGKILCDDSQLPKELPVGSSVSMNFWCFHPSIFNISEKMFHDFIQKNIGQPKAEFFIPIVADEFIKLHNGTVQVIPTSAQWFGVTYKEDAPGVKHSLDTLINSGEYPSHLWV
jgi:NDP-sugar pyrophosphorylase family protein